ncbi:MAG: hypothetical protein EOM77_03655 [Bacteroidia bacterium]|nr:hypothetical protein [Bacteroidia bacterium]
MALANYCALRGDGAAAYIFEQAQSKEDIRRLLCETEFGNSDPDVQKGLYNRLDKIISVYDTPDGSQISFQSGLCAYNGGDPNAGGGGATGSPDPVNINSIMDQEDHEFMGQVQNENGGWTSIPDDVSITQIADNAAARFYNVPNTVTQLNILNPVNLPQHINENGTIAMAPRSLFNDYALFNYRGVFAGYTGNDDVPDRYKDNSAEFSKSTSGPYFWKKKDPTYSNII